MASESASLPSMDFRLYSSLTRSVETITPHNPGELSYYACGPTVYSYAHIGNFRSFLTADLIIRVAQAIGWKTKFVVNITDVGHLSDDDYADCLGEDKMQRALYSKEGEAFSNIWDLARYYDGAFLADWKVLNLTLPDVQPRATEHITQQIESIEKLIGKGHAYETSLGVYFHVPSFAAYGKLSGNKDVADLSGSRDVTIDPEKRDPRDFALWKKDERHLMRWFSPWGWGYPGWHIECSAMAIKYLGPTIDIHSGGVDNRFPHHECEIAQSEAMTGKEFVKYWVHTAHLQVEGKRMGKSNKNFFTVRDLTEGQQRNEPVDPRALRMALTSGKYRDPFNFTFEQLRACGKAVKRIQSAYDLVVEAARLKTDGPDLLGGQLEERYQAALKGMLNDLNTSEAYAQVSGGVSFILRQDKPISTKSATSALNWFEQINSLLGIVRNIHKVSEGDLARKNDTDNIPSEIQGLVVERDEARRIRNFKRADEIRAQLLSKGYEIVDGADGVKVKQVKA